MSLWKRMGCQTESKAFEKSIVERIVLEPSPGFVKNGLSKEQSLI